MKGAFDYTKEVKLKHNELPAKFNVETNEYKTVKTRKAPNINLIVHDENAIFMKTYTNSWKYLLRVLKAHEFKAAVNLAMEAKAFTNSLEPLNDDTIMETLADKLGVGINQVKTVAKVLFEQGVYGKFQVANDNKPFHKYWVFNPYLSFNGKVIDHSIADLFKDTKVAKAFRNEL